MAVLEIDNLSIAFSTYQSFLKKTTVPVVNNLSLTIAAGEIVAVAGASGSGKSLLAHAIMGLLPSNAQTSGAIRYQGKLLDQKLLNKVRGSELRLVPQSASFLNPLLKVGNQLKQSEIFDISAMKRLYPYQLSGGMARKVLLSTAISPQTKLIIADEPTPGLDPQAVALALEGIVRLARQGCAVLFITHDLEAAAAIADRVAVMQDGQCVDIAPASQFVDNGSMLQHAYSRQLWRALPVNGMHLDDVAEIKTAELMQVDWGKDVAGKQWLLSCRNLSFRYPGGKWLFRHLQFEVHAGEIAGLSGPSGTGKTSLARILAQFDQPAEGELKYSWDKQDQSDLQSEQCKLALQDGQSFPVQLVLQHPEHAFNPKLRLRQSLAESWMPSNEFLNRLNINPGWLDRFPHELSGGELQRLNIARALHPRTKVLIADEMTAMLDAITQASLWREVLSIAAERKMAIIVISHDRYLMEQLCSKQLIIVKEDMATGT